MGHLTHLREIEKALFDAARNVTDPAAREALLEQTCNGNSDLRTRIERLLAVQGQAEEFFTVHPFQESPGETAMASATSAEFPGEEPAATEGPNTLIGRYRLVQRMGEGGCGVVYLAEQEQPVRRRVALKIIRLGMDTENVIARFEVERQALALMDHPNIAHVLDAGATGMGRPYFVMELVRGVKITQYCDEHGLNVRQRLDLFTQVCHAIQHAHQKGVIHRDIKPSNILVTLHDGIAVPKVIDFGIAKATDGRLADNPAFTPSGQFIGTPAYMSPEQAEMGGVDIDTRSDIYSLGALLYELLTGRTPFDNKQLVELGWDEMRRTLREKEPLRPSTMVASLPPNDLKAVAGQRRVEPVKMVSLLKGDLDWIVMKAMEKERTRRYETANGLAMDVMRYLSDEPVIARPPSKWYRLQKLARRNRAVFASGAAVALALILGLGTSTWLFFREREARQEAERGRASEALLRQQAEARAVIGQAAALVGENQFDQADQLMEQVTFPENGLAGEAVFRPLGDWAAVQGRWLRAAEYLKMLVRIDQMETWDVATLDCTRCAVALIKAGDTNGYVQFRREFIKRFVGTHDPVVAERTLKNSLLLPANNTIMTALIPLANQSANAVPVGTPTAAEEPWPGAIAWRCDSLALWSYRRAQYNDAVNYSLRCLSYGNDNPARAATANAILAMSYYRLGQFEDARGALAASRNLAESNLHGGLGLGDGSKGYWFDWTLERILMEQATTLIESKPSQSASRKLPSGTSP